MMKKSVPATSPDAYVASLTGWQQRHVQALRAAVVGAAPLREVIKWGHLVYFSNGPALLIRAEDERVLFGFWRGQRLRGIEPRLKPGGKYEMATLVLAQETPLAQATVCALVEAAVALNASLGDPTDLSASLQRPSTAARTRVAPVETHPLSPARLADFMRFFDGPAFSDNPKWSSCYCQCFYEDHAKLHWASRTAAQNRACAEERTSQGRMQGLLAYRDGQVVGWCNAAPRPLLHALDTEPVANPDQVGTILCFLVAPSARGEGVATALLAAACRQLKSQGLLSVEANPHPNAKGTAENHYGPLGMYLAAGFALRRTDADGSVWVGKAL